LRPPSKNWAYIQFASIALGYFIKMARFDKTLEEFRKDSVSHGKTWIDI
jgi:hypothetical protein